jgi:TrmH family RNA methyltransferase
MGDMKPVSWYKSLSQPRVRRAEGYFLVEGRRAVCQLLSFHRDSVEELLCVDGVDALNAPPSLRPENTADNADDYTIDAAGIPVRAISAANMKSISTSRTPQGVAALVRIPPDAYTSEIPQPLLTNDDAAARVLLLEHVQDPGNVGTLIRTAAAFGYHCVILSGQCADPFSPKAVQSTAGSILSLYIRRSGEYTGMAAELKKRGYTLIAADLDGEDTYTLNGAGRRVIALGSEGAGLSGGILDIADKKIRIPIDASAAESLNVAAAGAIMMFMGTQ